VNSSPGETGAGRVVIAEANPVTAGALSWLLREQGYAVTSVSNREELFIEIARGTPDLILLDNVLQRDGAILAELRRDERWHDVRVIVTTPWSTTAGGEDGMPWGADDCVAEPFRVPELLGRVRTQLRASGQLRAARSALRDTAAELERARDDAVRSYTRSRASCRHPRFIVFSHAGRRTHWRSHTAPSFWRAPVTRSAPLQRRTKMRPCTT
jgi:DNA-binding response OmpR family regulator